MENVPARAFESSDRGIENGFSQVEARTRVVEFRRSDEATEYSGDEG